MIKVEGDDSIDETTDDAPEISLRALTGIRTGKTMQLQVFIKGEALRALVDSGSTHTFVVVGVARHLGQSLEPRSGLTVTVANGDRVEGTCVCVRANTTIIIEHETFSVDCYTITLDGFDLVLGVQWL